MNFYIEIEDKGVLKTVPCRRAYLSRFVDPKKEYPVSYTVNQDGSRIYENTFLKGEDLTENQIAILFSQELL